MGMAFKEEKLECDLSFPRCADHHTPRGCYEDKKEIKYLNYPARGWP